MTTENATSAPKKSLTELLVEAEARVERLKAKIAAEKLINNVDVGDEVSFSYGRNGLGVGKRTLNGVVTAKGETDQGLKLVITVGEGIDVETYKVFARDLTANATKGTVNTTANDEDYTTEADPLAAE